MLLTVSYNVDLKHFSEHYLEYAQLKLEKQYLVFFPC